MLKNSHFHEALWDNTLTFFSLYQEVKFCSYFLPSKPAKKGFISCSEELRSPQFLLDYGHISQNANAPRHKCKFFCKFSRWPHGGAIVFCGHCACIPLFCNLPNAPFCCTMAAPHTMFFSWTVKSPHSRRASVCIPSKRISCSST